MNEKTDKPEEPGIDVRRIVDSIRNDVYLDDFEGFEKRLRQIRERHEFYHLPDLSREYPPLGVWPLKPIATVALKIFRKLYFWHSSNQREAFYQLMEEVKVLYVALRTVRNETSSRQKENDGRES